MNYLIPIITLFVTILFGQYVYIKIVNYKSIGGLKYILGFVFSLLLAFIIYLLREPLPNFRFAIMIFALATFASLLTSTEFMSALTAVIISVGICYSVFLISALITTSVIHAIYTGRRDLLMLFIAIPIHASIIIFLFKIRRFSKGIPFLKKKAASSLGLIICGLIVLILMLINRGPSEETGAWLFVGIALCSTGIIYWWRNGLTKQYREKIMERNIQDLERIIKEKEIQINKLQEDNEMMARIIHRDNKILPALVENVLLYMRSDENILANGNQILEQVELLIEERTGVLRREIKESAVTESQMNPIIDGVIKHMMMRASSEGVQFEIAEMSDFATLIDSFIKPIKFQTLLVDLIENAINATKDSNTKRVLISLCEDNGIYDLSVYDSGIYFDTETLINLGRKKTTTRTREGGSGLGYMEIFKIIEESNASLTITEYEPELSHFTKSISIRFDDKAEHILHTFRAEKIMGYCSDDVSIPLMKILNSKAMS